MSILLVVPFKLSTNLRRQSEDEREYISCAPYVSVVSSIMYAMVRIKPVILVLHM